MPRVIVTCGPSYEPIDEVRRITNASTGELGARLANRLTTAGREVLCFRGEAATWAGSLDAAQHIAFSTNADLLAKLTTASHADDIAAVFHAAALADFRVVRHSADRKIPSRVDELTLALIPAPKLLGRLRGLFGNARIVGWKYELDGTRDEALEKGATQIAENASDACVVNGAAYGQGFGFLEKGGALTHAADKPALCELLSAWVG